jgi:hypothetical protein
MHFDRFDICEAHYLAFMHYHTGQWSEEYQRMCRIKTYFTPRPSLSVETLTENGREIYEALATRLLNNL